MTGMPNKASIICEQPAGHSVRRLGVFLILGTGALLVFVVIAITVRSLWPNRAELVGPGPEPGRTKAIPMPVAVSPTATLATQVGELSSPASEDAAMAAWLGVSPSRVAAMSAEGMAPYQTILASLDLTPAQLRRIKQLIVERLESGKDASQLGKENQLTADETEVVQHRAHDAVERAMEELLPPQKFQVVREAVRLTPQLEEIAHFVAPSLEGEGVPLSAPQLLRLAQNYREAYAGEIGPPIDRSAGFDPQTGLGDADRKLLAAAVEYLSPPQIRVLQSKLSRPSGG